MKMRRGADRAVPRVSIETLAGWPTKQLLARLARLRFCEDSREMSDMEPAELEAAGDGILFKDSSEWEAAYAELKQVLAQREHIPRPAEHRKVRRW